MKKNKLFFVIVLSAVFLTACGKVEVIEFNRPKPASSREIAEFNKVWFVPVIPDILAHEKFDSFEEALAHAKTFYKDEDFFYSLDCDSPESFFESQTWERLEATICQSGFFVVEYPQ